MLLGSRRAFFTVGAASSLVWTQEAMTTQTISLQKAITIVEKHCPHDFLSSVVKTGRCLYRGENMDSSTIVSARPDLLQPETYGNEDALAYFQCIEDQLRGASVGALPSTGHIATTEKSEAARWGVPASVWPLGGDFQFVWPRSRRLIFPGADRCPDNDLVLNQDLSVALKYPREILFATNATGQIEASSYLAIPGELDRYLLRMLASSMK
jgi:hypothetical protein|uniref:Uncharacterized protein n=1 Tax=Phaeodactylum tricornutum TaxID=2850 RepID=A0A8J9X871_PHATR